MSTNHVGVPCLLELSVFSVSAPRSARLSLGSRRLKAGECRSVHPVCLGVLVRLGPGHPWPGVPRRVTHSPTVTMLPCPSTYSLGPPYPPAQGRCYVTVPLTSPQAPGALPLGPTPRSPLGPGQSVRFGVQGSTTSTRYGKGLVSDTGDVGRREYPPRLRGSGTRTSRPQIRLVYSRKGSL